MDNKYHVTQREDGTWQGKKEGGDKPSATGNTQKEVTDKVTGMAKRQGSSQVFIHGEDGRIRDERTYPRKDDPYPPKG